jgi:hypothetical protein
MRARVTTDNVASAPQFPDLIPTEKACRANIIGRNKKVASPTVPFQRICYHAVGSGPPIIKGEKEFVTVRLYRKRFKGGRPSLSLVGNQFELLVKDPAVQFVEVSSGYQKSA